MAALYGFGAGAAQTIEEVLARRLAWEKFRAAQEAENRRLAMDEAENVRRGQLHEQVTMPTGVTNVEILRGTKQAKIDQPYIANDLDLASTEESRARTGRTQWLTERDRTIENERIGAMGRLKANPIYAPIVDFTQAGVTTKGIDPTDPTGETGHARDIELENLQGRNAMNVAMARTEGRAEKPSAGFERSALRYYMRMRDSIDDMDTLEKDVAKQSTAGVMWDQNAPNWMKTKLGQQYIAAMRRFTEARLRKESGAAVPDAEYLRDQQMYGFQPGDSPEVTAAKQKGRRKVMEGLGFESGRAYEEYYGAPFKPGQSMQGGATGPARLQNERGEVIEVDNPDKAEFLKSQGWTEIP